MVNIRDKRRTLVGGRLVDVLERMLKRVGGITERRTKRYQLLDT